MARLYPVVWMSKGILKLIRTQANCELCCGNCCGKSRRGKTCRMMCPICCLGGFPSWLILGHVQQFRTVLTNKPIKLRLKLLDAVVPPTILFGLVTICNSATDTQRIDSTRCTAQSIVGWARMEDENWRGTMARMRGGMQAIRSHPLHAGPRN